MLDRIVWGSGKNRGCIAIEVTEGFEDSGLLESIVGARYNNVRLIHCASDNPRHADLLADLVARDARICDLVVSWEGDVFEREWPNDPRVWTAVDISRLVLGGPTVEELQERIRDCVGLIPFAEEAFLRLPPGADRNITWRHLDILAMEISADIYYLCAATQPTLAAMCQTSSNWIYDYDQSIR